MLMNPRKFEEQLVPSLTYQFVPDIWFESPGSWAELGQMGLHMWFAEPWEYVTVVKDDG